MTELGELTLRIFGVPVRGDFLLMVLFVIAATIVFVAVLIVQTFRRDPLTRLLSRPEILDLIKSDNSSLKEIISHINSARTRDPMIAVFEKIMDDIQWDVAGLIGVGVTVVLMFMVVSGTQERIPPEILSGWSVILGYYFGKFRHGSIKPGQQG